MSRATFIVAYLTVTGVLMPVLMPDWGPKLLQALVIAALYVAVLVGVALRHRVALWIAFIVLLAQLACLESTRFTFFMNAGYGVRVGLAGGRDLLDSGIGFNLYNGYFASFAIGSIRGIRSITDGVSVMSAAMVNIMVIPPLVALWPMVIKKKDRKIGEQPAHGDAEESV